MVLAATPLLTITPIDEDAFFVSILVPESEFMSYADALQLALERSKEAALNLEAAAKAALGVEP